MKRFAKHTSGTEKVVSFFLSKSFSVLFKPLGVNPLFTVSV